MARSRDPQRERMVRHRERQKIRLHCRVIAVCARAPSWGSSALLKACSQSQFSLLLLFSLTLAAAQHDSGNDSRLMFSDEIVSCYKDPAELVLFHDVEMKGHMREGSIRWELVRIFQDGSFLALEKSGQLPLSKSRNTLLRGGDQYLLSV